MDLRSPSTLLTAWALAPLLVVVASAALGWGLGLLGGSSLGALTVPAGFCAGIALMTLCLTIGFSGKLTVAVAAVCAVGALVLATVRLRRRGGLRRAGRVRLRDPSLAWPGSAALFAYAIALAPVAGSGHSGVLGYVFNNDPSVHITLIEALVDGPAHPSQVQADSFHHTTAEFAYGYPLGSLPWPLFARVFTGIPAFHLWSPLSALVLGLMALVAYDLLRTLEMPRPGAAAAGALVALGHLVYAYHVQGGTKEILLPLTVYATAALTARAFASELGWRSLVPAAVAAAAVLADIGYVGVVWLGPPGLLALIVLGWRARRSGSYRELRALGAFAAIALAVALPIALRSVDFFKGAASLIANPAAIGNLYLPIGLNRTLNVWLAHDYRFATADAPFFSAVGIWLAGAMAVAGCLYAVRRRNLGIALALVAGWAGVAIVTPRASIYFAAKTLVVLAPALGIASAAGVLCLFRSGRVGRIAALAVGALLAVLVIASDAYVYSGAWVTPGFRFEELSRIDDRYRGQGPILVDEREHYATYLLRDARPWVEYSFRFPVQLFRTGAPLPGTPDPDAYVFSHVESFPLVLERKQPTGSRPPSNFRLDYATSHYEVYRRVGPAPRAHVPLGGLGGAGASTVPCTHGSPRAPAVRSAVAQARRLHASLRVQFDDTRVAAAVESGNLVLFKPARLPTPPRMAAVIGGALAGEVDLAPGRYVAWIQGSFGPGVGLYVRPASRLGFGLVGIVSNDLGLPDQWHRINVTDIAGRTVVLLLGLQRDWYKTGSRHFNIIGPVVFVPANARRGMADVPPARAGSLCGRRVDWIEIPAAT